MSYDGYSAQWLKSHISYKDVLNEPFVPKKVTYIMSPDMLVIPFIGKKNRYCKIKIVP